MNCFRQARMVLVWFRKGEDKTLLGTGFAVSRAAAYRYIAEAIAVLSAQAPDLHTALQRVAADGWSHVILDGKLFAIDRLAEATGSVKGEQIDAWYSGKHRDFGANIQAIMRPDGLSIWTSDAAPGHLHDFTCAQLHDIIGALYWAASQLDLPTLADSIGCGGGCGAGTGPRDHGVSTVSDHEGRPCPRCRLAARNRSASEDDEHDRRAPGRPTVPGGTAAGSGSRPRRCRPSVPAVGAPGPACGVPAGGLRGPRGSASARR